jgi:acetyl esterase/lipase
MRFSALWLGRIALTGIFLLMSTTENQAATAPPTLANVHYGLDERQVLDFWKAPSPTPTPVAFYVHGGGWLGSDKSAIGVDLSVDRLLANGISVVSINYRYIKQTILVDKGVVAPSITSQIVATEDPPVIVPLHDARRALQFVRSKAAEWNIDKARISLSGGSAGGCSCLWLAFHKDMAQPANSDPVARESTRPWCVAVSEPQTSLDPKQVREWIPNATYGGHAFGFCWDPNDKFAEINAALKGRDIVLPWIKEYSPYELLTADAPPIYLYNPHDAPAKGEDRKDPNHTANYGALLVEKTKRLGVECEFNYLGAPGIAHPTIMDYLIYKLKAPTQK